MANAVNHTRCRRMQDCRRRCRIKPGAVFVAESAVGRTDGREFTVDRVLFASSSPHQGIKQGRRQT